MPRLFACGVVEPAEFFVGPALAPCLGLREQRPYRYNPGGPILTN